MIFISIIALFLFFNSAFAINNGALSVEDLEYLTLEDSTDIDKLQKIGEKMVGLDDKTKNELTKQIVESKKFELLGLLYLNERQKCLDVLRTLDWAGLRSETKMDYIYFFSAPLKNIKDGVCNDSSQKPATDFLLTCLDDKDNEVVSTALFAANRYLVKGLSEKVYLIVNDPKYNLKTRVDGMLYLRKHSPNKAEVLKTSLTKEIEALHDIQLQVTYADEIGDDALRNKILLKGLISDISEKRLFSYLELNKLTGKTFNYNPIGSKEEIEQSVAQWKRYLEEILLKK